MDESTLNDLLECSVCLDRLDDSKVLPCQHTFCKKCLEVIVASQKELRCPECRILVDSKIDDLPPNVLLMRILEGLKNANSNIQSTPSKQPETNSSKVEKKIVNARQIPQSHNNKVNYEASSQSISLNLIECHKNYVSNPVSISQRQILPQIRENHSSGVQSIPKALALYDFQSKEVGDLKFNKGDVVLIKRKIDANWLYGISNGKEGMFPINYVQIIVPLPVPQCIALYDFKMGPNEEDGCLTFKKGTVINVLRRVDQNWAEGRIGASIGIFPIAFAEMNSLAKHVLQQKEEEMFTSDSSKNTNTSRVGIFQHVARSLPPLPTLDTNLSDSTTSSSSSSALLSPNSSCSSSSNSVSNSPINQIQNKMTDNSNIHIRHRNINKEKRNSLNGLTGSKNFSVASNRYSAEILSTSHEPTQKSLQQSGLNVVNACGPSKNIKQIVPTDGSQKVEKQNFGQIYRDNVLKQQPNVPPNLPWYYIALYPYKPKKVDELELKKGCIYIVTERCLDGWFKGKNWLEKSGVFPGNYVAALRSNDHQKLMEQKKLAKHSENVQPLNSSNSLNFLNNTLPELPPRTPNALGVGAVNASFSENTIGHVDSLDKHSNLTTESKEIKNIGACDVKDIAPNKIQNNPIIATTSSSVSSLVKRLTNIKRSKSPTQPSTHNDDVGCKGNLFSKEISLLPHPIHVRSGSCPSQLLQTLPGDTAKEYITKTSSKNESPCFASQRLKGSKERPSLQSVCATAQNLFGNAEAVITSNPSVAINMITHRKTQSLDATCKVNQLTVNNSIKTSNNREGRFRCIVSYPPNSEFELELNVGDIVFVHRKQKNGWYKGTHSKTNKTGLFPASFVEPLL
ncbi:E3 ubiquitin-protein ligase SH3RF3 [Condylostylus longicornis]|uniref:E3 ubiquitin-protein ligase SH3RF3 n=1 Tax=Condylostylus longicornis TaxID=2530218 RepID=UPI00244DCA11|nr:E3 ubiquitin-protein ligase SH3RF3 [Condylostylus longicornis]